MLVTGQAHDTLLIRAYTDTTLQWQDTVAIPASSGGLRAQMQSLADGVFIVFGNPVGFVGRFLGPSGFGPELVIESQTGYQGGHQWLVSDSAVVAAWANRDLEELWIQHVHFPDGQARWPGGAYVGRVDAWTGPPWLDLCAGGAYGYVMGGWRAVLYIQPADSLVLDAAPFPRATPADEARLFLSPNPCNGPMQIEFELPRPGHATLDLFNVLGQAVMTLTDDWRPAGVHIVSWQPESAGKYFVRLRHDGHTAVASFIYLP